MRHVGSDPQAERGRGEVNLSPIRVLTLRPRVGGFHVSGRLWEAPSVVFYEVWRLREVQILTAYAERVGPVENDLTLLFRAWV